MIMSWGPIIDRARVAPVLSEIVTGIDHGDPDRRDAARPDYALLRTYLDSDGAVADPDDRAGDAMSEAIEALAAEQTAPGLYGGAARIGWTVAHCASGDDAEAVCRAIDQALLRRLDDWTAEYDLISGLVGLGVYAIERGAAGAAVLGGVLTGLEGYAARGWLTPPALLPDHQRAVAPGGYVNFGLAHGVPGVVALTAQLCGRGIEPARSRALLEDALRRMLDANPPRAHGRFASWHPTERPPSPRLAWCYDDLGAAAALLVAGVVAGHAEAHDAGLAVARDCAARSYDDARISDAGICHGAAGIAHVFNRMAQATGDAALRDAAVRWIDHTLAIRRTEPIAGFPADLPGPDGKRAYVPDPTLLTGAAGVALVLHAASSEIEPLWDRLLQVDLPPRS